MAAMNDLLKPIRFDVNPNSKESKTTQALARNFY